jgi:hypothetical protein
MAIGDAIVRLLVSQDPRRSADAALGLLSARPLPGSRASSPSGDGKVVNGGAAGPC